MQKTIGYIVELHAICEQTRLASLSHLGELCHPLCSVNSSACLRLCNSNCPNMCTVLAFMCIVFVCYILCIHVTGPVSRSAGCIMFPCIDHASVGQVCPSKLLMCMILIWLPYCTKHWYPSSNKTCSACFQLCINNALFTASVNNANSWVQYMTYTSNTMFVNNA